MFLLHFQCDSALQLFLCVCVCFDYSPVPCKIIGTKSSSARSSSTKAIDNKAMLPFNKLLSSLDDINEEDFDDDGVDESGADKDLTQALGIKHKPEKPEKGQKEKKNDLETMSKIESTDNGKSLKEKIYAFKIALDKEIVAIESIHLQLKSFGSSHKKDAQNVMKLKNKMEVPRDTLKKYMKSPFNREDLKQVLVSSYKYIKAAKETVRQLKKAGKLVKQTKKVIEEEEEEDDIDEEEAEEED